MRDGVRLVLPTYKSGVAKFAGAAPTIALLVVTQKAVKLGSGIAVQEDMDAR